MAPIAPMAQVNVVVTVVILKYAITCPPVHLHPWYPPRVALVAQPLHMNVVARWQKHMVVVAVAGHTIPDTQPSPTAVMAVPVQPATATHRLYEFIKCKKNPPIYPDK